MPGPCPPLTIVVVPCRPNKLPGVACLHADGPFCLRLTWDSSRRVLSRIRSTATWAPICRALGVRSTAVNLTIVCRRAASVLGVPRKVPGEGLAGLLRRRRRALPPRRTWSCTSQKWCCYLHACLLGCTVGAIDFYRPTAHHSERPWNECMPSCAGFRAPVLINLLLSACALTLFMLSINVTP